MTTFTATEETRWYIGEITDTARAFANGDDDKLAAAAFARLLRQSNIEFEWSQLDGAHFLVGKDQWWPVRVKGVKSTSTLVPMDALDAATPWVAYVNLAVENVAVVMGLSYRTEREVEAKQLLCFDEWALAFRVGAFPTEAA